MKPFSLLVRAFRAAVRAEVERALADRRHALGPVDNPEMAALKIKLRAAGLKVVEIAPLAPSGAVATIHDRLTDADREAIRQRWERMYADPSWRNIIPFPAANANNSEPPPSAA